MANSARAMRRPHREWAGPLVRACWDKIPAGIRSTILPADKGFYDHALVEWREARRAGFVIVGRLTWPIKRKLPHLRDVTASRDVEVAEFRYQPARWPHPHRFVMVRRSDPDEPTAKLTLFQLGRYRYQVFVTNLSLRPLNLWRLYNDRAGVELRIRQLSGHYALGSIPTRHFFANATYFHLARLTTSSTGSSRCACLRTSRGRPYTDPAAQDVAHWRAGLRGSLALGWSHALYCLGCCWALRVVLVAAGAMGLAWVLLITAVVAAERLLPRGEWIARATGGAFLLLGVAVTLRPDLVTALRGGHAM